MTLDYIIWNPNPEIFRIGSFAIRWYGLFFVLAFYISYLLLGRMFKREGVKAELLDKLTMYMLISTIIGARLGHCFFYEWNYFSRHPLEILYIWQGGLASHGAAMAIIIALWLFAKNVKEVSFLWVIDRIVIMVAMAGFFIRMGNLMNSEIYGNPTKAPWGFAFIRDQAFRLHNGPLLNYDFSREHVAKMLDAGVIMPNHPTQIYEAVPYLLIFFFLLWFYKKYWQKVAEGFIFGLFLILLFTVRFVVEFIKEPQVEFEKAMTLNMGQWLSLPFILAGLAIIFYVNRKKKNQSFTTPIKEE